MYQNILKLKENPETANAGKKWTDGEFTELLLQRKNEMPLEPTVLSRSTYIK